MNASVLYSMKEFRFSYGAERTDALVIPVLKLAEGTCVALVGANGSGKTTLLKLLNGLLPGGLKSAFYSGELRFRGEALCSGGASSLPPALRRSTVYMHQHPYMLSGSVARNLDFVCRARGIEGKKAAQVSAEALALVGLDGVSMRRKHGLSGGETQRLALARVIASGAEVLLLDEPTASADLSSRDLIAGALSQMVKTGTTVIFSAHGSELIDAIAARVIEFDRGTIAGDSGSRDAARYTS
ncbi:MAG: ABC transporter ATP-binding protein [Spirochaetes bacterium]|nr:ABC transporter ATP-binding protein [Spirochaetota bacterium]